MCVCSGAGEGCCRCIIDRTTQQLFPSRLLHCCLHRCLCSVSVHSVVFVRRHSIHFSQAHPRTCDARLTTARWPAFHPLLIDERHLQGLHTQHSTLH